MKICVVMPAYNEAEGITEFLAEGLAAFDAEFDLEFVVVNDASQDATADRIHDLSSSGFPVRCHTNIVNSGHGVSTRRALEAGVESGADVILAVDGDGQFSGADLQRVVVALDDEVEVVEGTRTQRSDPFYRKITSFATRVLVWGKCGRMPRDANTPLRAYRAVVLEDLLNALPPDLTTPNLFISAMSRKWGLEIHEIQVVSLPRRGSVAVGSTWGNGPLRLPSRRFMKFCWSAAGQWISTPVPIQVNASAAS